MADLHIIQKEKTTVNPIQLFAIMKQRFFYFILLAFLLIPAAVFSQETLRDEIMSYEQSRHDFLDKGRRLLLDSFEKNDMLKTKEVKNLLLKENEGNVYHTFYPIEYIYLLYWTEEYKELTDFIKQVDFNNPVSNSVSMLARIDNLYPTLLQKTVEHKDILIIAIQNSSETAMDKDFLILQLEDIIRAGTNSGRGIDVESDETKHINDLSDAFLENYPDSPYDKIIRETIRYKFEESPWAFYWDITGFGAVIPTRNLSNYFGTGFTMEMAFDVRYKKLVGIFGFGFSGHSLKQDIPINDVIWSNESPSSHGLVYLNGGYLLLDTKRFSLYPFVGMGYGGISADGEVTKEYPELEKLGLNSFFTQVGIGCDFKFKLPAPYYYMYSIPNNDPDNAYSRISVRYSFRMPKYEMKYKGMDGFTHSIVVSWGLGGRTSRRVK